MYDRALETGGDGCRVLVGGRTYTKSCSLCEHYFIQNNNTCAHQLVPRSPLRTTSSRGPWLLFSSCTTSLPFTNQSLGNCRVCFSHAHPCSSLYMNMPLNYFHPSPVRSLAWNLASSSHSSLHSLRRGLFFHYCEVLLRTEAMALIIQHQICSSQSSCL